jgi:hypothetical protein
MLHQRSHCGLLLFLKAKKLEIGRKFGEEIGSQNFAYSLSRRASRRLAAVTGTTGSAGRLLWLDEDCTPSIRTMLLPIGTLISGIDDFF